MTTPRKHKIIAIDGPAASGKGTLARRLAAHLGYAFLETGMLYRAVGYAVLQDDNDPADETVAIFAAQNLAKTLRPEDLQNPALRTDAAGSAASNVAKFEGVREALLRFQKDFAYAPKDAVKGVILDGRDIGTVICPDADVKLFVTATVETRAMRRLKELQSKNINTDFETVLHDMKARDARDSGRDTAPLKPASDAHIIDTSDLNADEAFKLSLDIITAKIR